MMKKRATFLGALCALLSAAACGGSDPADDCSAGEEGCACLEDGSCDAGLSCLSDLCVASTVGTGGDSQGTGGDSVGTGGESGGNNTGGTPTGGGDSGGTDAGGGSGGEGTGGEGAGGAPETGGSGGDGTGGDGSGGETSCGDTSSDPENCGSCDHQCRDYYDEPGTCTNGVCGEAHSECFDEVAAADAVTCSEYCSSVLGEVCVNQGCGGQNHTWRRWDALSDCDDYGGPVAFSGIGDACSATLPLTAGGDHYFRCCCAETP